MRTFLSVEAVYNYLNWLEKAFVIYRCQRYDLQWKIRAENTGKVLSGGRFPEILYHGLQLKSIAAMLENIVYFEPRRRGYEVYIGKNETKEIDFVAVRGATSVFMFRYAAGCRRNPTGRSPISSKSKTTTPNMW